MTISTTSNQIQKHKLQLISSMVIGVLLLTCGTWELFFGHRTNHWKKTWLALLLICFGIDSLILGFKNWLTFSREKPLFVVKQAIALKDGELTIEGVPPFCELWIFCDVSFFYLWGTIQIKRDSCTASQTVSVPRHSP
jgi:hypothetical protein